MVGAVVTEGSLVVSLVIEGTAVTPDAVDANAVGILLAPASDEFDIAVSAVV